MNALIQSNTKTMTSVEISELTGKRHSDVTRDINSIQDRLDNREFAVMSGYMDSSNRKRTMWILDFTETMTLLTGYSPDLRMMVIDRWQELEAKEQFTIPQTLPEALQLAADLALKIEQDKPKIEVYEKLADRKGDVSTTIIAKQLGTSAIKLNKFLRDNGIKWLNSDLPKAGYMEYFNVVGDVKNGHEFTQCLVTPLGQIEIAKLWEAK